MRNGFTLVELSIVLVIIGLIVGGVLVGRDMIFAAEVRSQIAQIERYNTAANTFRGRFGGIPGDIRDYTKFVDLTEWADVQDGDGNRLIRDANAASAYSGPAEIDEHNGEIAQFWLHLSSAQLIKGTYDGGATIGRSFPWSENERCGVGVADLSLLDWSGVIGRAKGNHFQIGLVSAPNPGTDDSVITQSCLTTVEAYSIDQKMDDGKPSRGKVIAVGDYDLSGGGTSRPGFGRFPRYFVASVFEDPSWVEYAVAQAANWLIPSAHAVGVPVIEDSCIWFDNSHPAGASVANPTLSYTTTAEGLHCQLSIRAAF